MAKKDKKKKTKEHKAKVAEKQDRKLSKKQKKEKSKASTEEQEDDIETILANFKKEQDEKIKIVEEVWSGPPSRRANATLTANPLNSNELIFFGGEFYDGARCQFFNDLYRYNIEKDEWRRITSPNSPGPRSAHQIAITPAGTLFLFGGEFASPNETQFFHYKDFWSMDMKTNAWEKLEIRPKPTARSGHRMTQWKQYLVMFGGFYDNYVDTRYYDDLWVFDTLDYKWIKVELPDQMMKPSARSGFSFIPCNEGVILYGGYCKEYTKGQRPKGIVHSDTWLLKMNTDIKMIRWEKKKKSGMGPSPRSGCAMAPYKNRAVLFGGVYDDDVNEETLESTFYNELYTYQIDTGRWFPMNLKKPKSTGNKKKKPKKKQIKAGGAGRSGEQGDDDDDEDGEKREKNKWEESTDDEFDYGDFDDDEDTETLQDKETEMVTLMDGEASKVASEAVVETKETEAVVVPEVSAAEALAAAALAAAGILPKAPVSAEPAEPIAATLDDKRKGSSRSRGQSNNDNNHNDDDEEEEEEPLMPCPRYNPMLAVQKSTLFIFGGILEVKDREYTLDDFFSLNLDKMTEYICLRASEFESQLWLGESSDDEEEGDDDDDDDDDSDSEEEDEDGEEGEEVEEQDDEAAAAAAAAAAKKEKKEKKDKKEKAGSSSSDKKDDGEKEEKKAKKSKKDSDAAPLTAEEKAAKKERKAKKAAAAAALAAGGEGSTVPSAGAVDGAVEGEEVEEEVVPSNLSGVDLAARLAMTEEETASTPTIGETLKEFYARTTEYWVMKAFEDSTKTGKALRQDGFLMCQAKFKDWQPVLAQMAQMRLDAGLDGEDDDGTDDGNGGRKVLKMGEVYNKLMSRHRR